MHTGDVLQPVLLLHPHFLPVREGEDADQRVHGCRFQPEPTALPGVLECCLLPGILNAHPIDIRSIR